MTIMQHARDWVGVVSRPTYLEYLLVMDGRLRLSLALIVLVLFYEVRFRRRDVVLDIAEVWQTEIAEPSKYPRTIMVG